jgi:flavin-dependent dehydrogenase
MQTIVKHLYCDVAIIGGGVGGCSTAMTTAKRGLHTILLDKWSTISKPVDHDWFLSAVSVGSN